MAVTPSSAKAPEEVLAGLIERVTFHNDENGFCVLRIKARGHRDLVTVVGHAATISAGEAMPCKSYNIALLIRLLRQSSGAAVPA